MYYRKPSKEEEEMWERIRAEPPRKPEVKIGAFGRFKDGKMIWFKSLEEWENSFRALTIRGK